MTQEPRIVSLTPAVFHLPEAVNAVSRTYGQSPIVPRGPKFAPLLQGVLRTMQDVLACPHHKPILLTGSGSSAMAAVIGSCLRETETLLVIRNGAYGDRIKQFAEQIKQPIVDLCYPYGERPDLDHIERILADKQVHAVAMVYGGTSTCTLNPIEDVGALCKKYGVKFLVDGVSALFVEEMHFDAWNISAVMGSCNKGLHSHPNITMALVREDLLDEMKGITSRTPSLELRLAYDYQCKGAHPYTIDPMSVLQVNGALQTLIQEGGVSGRHRIYQQRSELLRAGYEALGLRITRFANQPLSSIGTALYIPTNRTYDQMANQLATDVVDGHLFEIYSAQGKLSHEIFRIFHMGDYPLSVYETFLKSLARVL